MREQAGEEVPAERDSSSLSSGGEGVGAGALVAQRLVQVPAARQCVLDLRPRHEGRVIALPAADLLHRAAEQHHGIGGRKAELRMEGELALARAELDLDRAQRQAERDNLAAHDSRIGSIWSNRVSVRYW